MPSEPGEDAPDADADADEGTVLAPEELDIEDDEHVAKLDEDRYVVSADKRIGDTVEGTAGDPTTPDAPTDTGQPGQPPEPELDEQAVHTWLEDRFVASDATYGFDVTAKFEDGVSQKRLVSNDVVTVFEGLVTWYAQGLDPTTPVEEVVGILLTESNVPIKAPAAALTRAMEDEGLSPDDDIAALFEAIAEDGGLLLE